MHKKYQPADCRDENGISPIMSVIGLIPLFSQGDDWKEALTLQAAGCFRKKEVGRHEGRNCQRKQH